ncbi:MAG: hypothetical protein J5I81_06765 [Nitrococcus mobilis]|nr:hypothetical protein [Nitrococcus mobilis]
MTSNSVLTAVAVMLSLAIFTPFATPAVAQSDNQPSYGRQLMSDQEVQEYSARMRNAKTAEERERIRTEHHQQMEVRAKERGVTLPEAAPTRGMGHSPRMGIDRGMDSHGGGRRN